jgi:predicted DNA-binding transcriptional regulator AlpA
METQRWIDEKEVAKITGIAVQTLRNWRFQQTGPSYFKLGRMVRYYVDDLIRFMEEKKINVS